MAAEPHVNTVKVNSSSESVRAPLLLRQKNNNATRNHRFLLTAAPRLGLVSLVSLSLRRKGAEPGDRKQQPQIRAEKKKKKKKC